VNKRDTQVLASFMRYVVHPDLDAPDFTKLDEVSDEGLNEFATRFAEVIEHPISPPANRVEAIRSIRELLDNCSSKTISIGDARNITVNSGLNHVEPMDNSGVRRQVSNKGDDWLDATHNITQRVLRFYRKLNGWVTLSALSNGMNSGVIKKFIAQAIVLESTRYKEEHPVASAEEAAHYIQREYIAQTGSEDRRPKRMFHRRRSPTWIDLSPKAQEDIKSILKEHHYHCKPRGAYSEAVNRPGWLTFERLGIHGISYLGQAKTFLNQRAAEMKQSYMQTSGMREDAAEQMLNDTYLFIATSGDKVRRILSPEAQGDLRDFLEEKFPGRSIFRNIGQEFDGGRQ